MSSPNQIRRVITDSNDHIVRVFTLASRPDTQVLYVFTYNIYCGQPVKKALKRLSQSTRVKILIGLPDNNDLKRKGIITDFSNELASPRLEFRWRTNCHTKGVLAAKKDVLGYSHTAIIGGHNLTLSSWDDVSIELTPPRALEAYYRRLWRGASKFPKRKAFFINGKKI